MIKGKEEFWLFVLALVVFIMAIAGHDMSIEAAMVACTALVISSIKGKVK